MRLSIIVASALLSACAMSRTTIQSSWADADYSDPPLDELAVVALFPTRTESLSFEQSAADYLSTQGVRALPGHSLLRESQTLDETQVRARLATADVDGILIFRFIAIDDRSEYQPPPSLLDVPPDVIRGDPFSWYYHPSSRYYWLGRAPADLTSSAGYWIEETYYVAETALYDNRRDRLLWTAKSETLDDARFQRLSESIVRTVARRLFASDLIAAQPAGAPRVNRANRANDG